MLFCQVSLAISLHSACVLSPFLDTDHKHFYKQSIYLYGNNNICDRLNTFSYFAVVTRPLDNFYDLIDYYIFILYLFASGFGLF